MIKSKKGIALGFIAKLILAIFVVILILTVVLAIGGTLSPSLFGMACGINVAIRDKVTVKFISPLLFCNQYETPIQINGAKKDAYPHLKDCFDGARGDVSATIECQKMCAQFQVDQLVGKCWAMGGRGEMNIRSLAKEGGIIFVSGVTPGEYDQCDILRCYQYQIVAPVYNSETKSDVKVYDTSYGLGMSNIISGKSFTNPGTGITRETIDLMYSDMLVAKSDLKDFAPEALSSDDKEEWIKSEMTRQAAKVCRFVDPDTGLETKEELLNIQDVKDSNLFLLEYMNWDDLNSICSHLHLTYQIDRPRQVCKVSFAYCDQDVHRSCYGWTNNPSVNLISYAN